MGSSFKSTYKVLFWRHVSLGSLFNLHTCSQIFFFFLIFYYAELETIIELVNSWANDVSPWHAYFLSHHTNTSHIPVIFACRAFTTLKLCEGNECGIITSLLAASCIASGCKLYSTLNFNIQIFSFFFIGLYLRLSWSF